MATKESKKEYSNGEVTIVWQAHKCIHSAKCVHGLPQVFKPNERPWIQIDQVDSQALIEQVKRCPSGALSFYLNDTQKQEESKEINSITKVEALQNGPLMVYGKLEIKNSDGQTVNKENATAFCRCGASANKPYCDGSHRKIDFEA